MLNKEENKHYKPLSSRSKFCKANKFGQVPKDCIHFTFAKKHCWFGFGSYDETACDCKVIKGELCEKYKAGI